MSVSGNYSGRDTSVHAPYVGDAADPHSIQAHGSTHYHAHAPSHVGVPGPIWQAPSDHLMTSTTYTTFSRAEHEEMTYNMLDSSRASSASQSLGKGSALDRVPQDKREDMQVAHIIEELLKAQKSGKVARMNLQEVSPSVERKLSSALSGTSFIFVSSAQDNESKQLVIYDSNKLEVHASQFQPLASSRSQHGVLDVMFRDRSSGEWLRTMNVHIPPSESRQRERAQDEMARYCSANPPQQGVITSMGGDWQASTKDVHQMSRGFGFHSATSASPTQICNGYTVDHDSIHLAAAQGAVTGVTTRGPSTHGEVNRGAAYFLRTGQHHDGSATHIAGHAHMHGAPMSPQVYSATAAPYSTGQHYSSVHLGDSFEPTEAGAKKYGETFRIVAGQLKSKWHGINSSLSRSPSRDELKTASEHKINLIHETVGNILAGMGIRSITPTTLRSISEEFYRNQAGEYPGGVKGGSLDNLPRAVATMTGRLKSQGLSEADAGRLAGQMGDLLLCAKDQKVAHKNAYFPKHKPAIPVQTTSSKIRNFFRGVVRKIIGGFISLAKAIFGGNQSKHIQGSSHVQAAAGAHQFISSHTGPASGRGGQHTSATPRRAQVRTGPHTNPTPAPRRRLGLSASGNPTACRTKLSPNRARGTLFNGNTEGLRFYNKSSWGYIFTNFWENPGGLSIPGVSGKVATSEHVFQALKFAHNPQMMKHIASQRTARDAFDEAGKNQSATDPDWHKDVPISQIPPKYQAMMRQHAEALKNSGRPQGGRSVRDEPVVFKKKDLAMLYALRKKAAANPDFARALLQTGDHYLQEDAGVKDAYWGSGADGKGQNKLGCLLMILRDELRNPSDPKLKTPYDHLR